MGDYAIERMLLAGSVFLLLLLAMIFMKKKRMIFMGLVIVVIIGYGIFFSMRAQSLEKQYEQSVELVTAHIEQQYPHEQYLVLDQLEEGRKRRANIVDITFSNEEQVIYTYRVINGKDIVQWEISTGNKSLDELLHNELK